MPFSRAIFNQEQIAKTLTVHLLLTAVMTPLFLTTSTEWSFKTFISFIPPSSNSSFWPIFTRKVDSAMFLLTVPQLLPITRSALRILRTLLVAKVPISQLVWSISTCACGANCAMGLDLNFYGYTRRFDKFSSS